MQTQDAHKIIDTMMAAKPPTKAKPKGVDADLIAIQNEYMENAPRVNWNEMGVINHMDILHTDPMLILL